MYVVYTYRRGVAPCFFVFFFSYHGKLFNDHCAILLCSKDSAHSCKYSNNLMRNRKQREKREKEMRVKENQVDGDCRGTKFRT